MGNVAEKFIFDIGKPALAYHVTVKQIKRQDGKTHQENREKYGDAYPPDQIRRSIAEAQPECYRISETEGHLVEPWLIALNCRYLLHSKRNINTLFLQSASE